LVSGGLPLSGPEREAKGRRGAQRARCPPLAKKAWILRRLVVDSGGSPSRPACWAARPLRPQFPGPSPFPAPAGVCAQRHPDTRMIPARQPRSGPFPWPSGHGGHPTVHIPLPRRPRDRALHEAPLPCQCQGRGARGGSRPEGHPAQSPRGPAPAPEKRPALGVFCFWPLPLGAQG
jgi:hypothetical protein